jgi:hypothetical protein
VKQSEGIILQGNYQREVFPCTVEPCGCVGAVMADGRKRMTAVCETHTQEDSGWESVVIIHPDAAKDFVRLFPDEVIEFIPSASNTTPEQEATLSRSSPEHPAVPTR